mmetsp:Transcript_32162/g.55546  ORF Transcript_32162/g.55546 Transcript_32162/m.55546 type:complete len:119 (-) Transcript_32162:144-500(-)
MLDVSVAEVDSVDDAVLETSAEFGSATDAVLEDSVVVSSEEVSVALDVGDATSDELAVSVVGCDTDVSSCVLDSEVDEVSTVGASSEGWEAVVSEVVELVSFGCEVETSVLDSEGEEG